MHKLPVFQTISRAYAFVIEEAGTIFRLSWLPLLIVAVVQYMALRTAIEMLARSPGGVEETSLSFDIWESLSSLISMIGAAIVAVSIHRLALFGERRDGSWFNVNFGKVELFFVLAPVALAASAIPIVALAFVLSAFLTVVMIIGTVLAGVWVMVRLSVLFPSVVVERRVAWREAWAMTRENFWRLFAVFLLGLLPLMFILVLIAFSVGTPPSPDKLSKNPAAFREQLELAITPLSLATNFVFSILAGAIGVALLSFSYIGLGGRR